MAINRPMLGGYTGEDPSSEKRGGGHGGGHEHDIPCNVLGKKIAKSAVEFEDSVSEYLRCQCMAIEKLLCQGKEEQIASLLCCFKENLEQICCIETQLLEKLDKGLSISHCEEEG